MDKKLIFDAVRRLLGRGFRQAEVAALDAAIDSALQPESPDPLSTPQAVSEAGLALIKRFEGCARRRADGLFEAYPDPGTGGAPWTIGWGHTGNDVRPGTVWTREQADRALERDLARHAAEVSAAIGPSTSSGLPTTQGQFDALVSFHYNTGAIARATLTRRHVAGDHAAAAREFARWNRAGGRVMAGLTRRREAEAALYAASTAGGISIAEPASGR